jgi:putative CocE/NonD family hydrolase
MIRVLLAVLALTLGIPQQRSEEAKSVREAYTKFEFEIPMRDGQELFTAVYVPKDSSQTYPIMLERTPYSVEPYGVDRYPAQLGPSDDFLRSGYIFAYQDVRGRYMSEGTWEEMRPYIPHKSGSKDVDESTDTWDTIDWLVRNIPGNNGKVGMWGVSYPGFYVSAGMIDAHPALAAASPQAPVTDLYLGDDAYHNGAYMLAANFGFYRFFRERKGPPAPDDRPTPFDYGTPDGYDFFLRMGPLGNANVTYFRDENRYWNEMVENTTYNDYWKARAIWKYLKGIKPAVMTVGGLFDAEDCQGPLRTHAFMEQNGPPSIDMLVLGPWTHGSWAWTDGDRVGNLNFASKTGVFFREKIEFPFFEYSLKGRGERKFPKAWVFETGTNRWCRYEQWPPVEAQARPVWLQSGGRLGTTAEAQEGFDEYTSDPKNPVPYLGYTAVGMRGDYMTEDQRFAAQRPDVLTYETEVLKEDLKIAGPIVVSLLVSTSGTDSDFVVKLIDVYPGNYPDYNASARRDGERPAVPAPANTVKLGAYQQLVRGEPFRGKFRRGFEKPVPFEPGKPDRIEFSMPDVCHVFRRGHRMMVQVQSSWFPLTDLNPQKFVEIPHAAPGDFQKAEERVYRGGTAGSRLVVRVVEGWN